MDFGTRASEGSVVANLVTASTSRQLSSAERQPRQSFQLPDYHSEVDNSSAAAPKASRDGLISSWSTRPPKKVFHRTLWQRC